MHWRCLHNGYFFIILFLGKSHKKTYLERRVGILHFKIALLKKKFLHFSLSHTATQWQVKFVSTERPPLEFSGHFNRKLDSVGLNSKPCRCCMILYTNVVRPIWAFSTENDSQNWRTQSTVITTKVVGSVWQRNGGLVAVRLRSMVKASGQN